MSIFKDLKNPTQEILKNFFYLCRKINLMSELMTGIQENLKIFTQNNETELYEIEFMVQYRFRNEIERLSNSLRNYKETYNFDQESFFSAQMLQTEENIKTNLSYLYD